MRSNTFWAPLVAALLTTASTALAADHTHEPAVTMRSNGSTAHLTP